MLNTLRQISKDRKHLMEVVWDSSITLDLFDYSLKNFSVFLKVKLFATNAYLVRDSTAHAFQALK